MIDRSIKKKNFFRILMFLIHYMNRSLYSRQRRWYLNFICKCEKEKESSGLIDAKQIDQQKEFRLFDPPTKRVSDYRKLTPVDRSESSVIFNPLLGTHVQNKVINYKIRRVIQQFFGPGNWFPRDTLLDRNQPAKKSYQLVQTFSKEYIIKKSYGDKNHFLLTRPVLDFGESYGNLVDGKLVEELFYVTKLSHKKVLLPILKKQTFSFQELQFNVFENIIIIFPGRVDHWSQLWTRVWLQPLMLSDLDKARWIEANSHQLKVTLAYFIITGISKNLWVPDIVFRETTLTVVQEFTPIRIQKNSNTKNESSTRFVATNIFSPNFLVLFFCYKKFPQKLVHENMEWPREFNLYAEKIKHRFLAEKPSIIAGLSWELLEKVTGIKSSELIFKNKDFLDLNLHPKKKGQRQQQGTRKRDRSIPEKTNSSRTRKKCKVEGCR
uniref:Uncharacterized protein n=1 Tax=Chaetophora lobata TaxID=1249516 RepID=A0A7U1G3G5_9CHLO|nr:hypothetical protein [Chaetophora lobata]